MKLLLGCEIIQDNSVRFERAKENRPSVRLFNPVRSRGRSARLPRTAETSLAGLRFVTSIKPSAFQPSRQVLPQVFLLPF